MNKYLLFSLLCICIFCIIYTKVKKILDKKLIENKNKKYYELDTFPELKLISKYKDNIKKELKLNLKNELDDWTDWPEKNLYDDTNIWKIMPFFYYGTWINKNCKKMPELVKFLKKLKNLRIALLSILSPNTALKEHKGWGYHSNNVLRCHYGLMVPEDLCYVSVKNDDEILGTIKNHKEHEWIIFDDSKFHFAANNSNYYRVVLIVDMKRPKNIVFSLKRCIHPLRKMKHRQIIKL